MGKRIGNTGKSTDKKKRISINPDTSKAVENRLLELMRQQPKKQADVAEQIGIARSTLSSVLNGGRLSLATAIELSRFFHVSLDFLCCLTDIESPAAIALDMLESQISLSSGQTKHGTTYLSAEISKPMADYLTALKSSDLPQDVKDYYVSTKREALIAAIANQTEPSEQDMQKYLILDFVDSDTSGYLPSDFEQAIDEYFR